MKHLPLLVCAFFGCAFGSTSAVAAEAPRPKPGMWETTMQQDADGKVSKPATLRHCIDAAGYARSKATADAYAKKNCSKNETHQEGGKGVSDMVCKVGPGTMTSHSVTAFNGENAYHSELTSTFDPPSPGHSRSVTTSDGKWTGACKPD